MQRPLSITSHQPSISTGRMEGGELAETMHNRYFRAHFNIRD